MLLPLRILLTGILFVGFTFFGTLISYVILPLVVLGERDPDLRSRRARRTLGGCARLYLEIMRLAGLYHLTQPRDLRVALATGRPSVIISNHPSLLDVLWLAALVPEAVFLAKAAWFRSPFISPILRLGDHVSGPVDRDAAPLMAGAIVLESMLDRLRRGHSLLVFPEGTRSPPRGIGTFQPGAFEAARRAGVPIIALFMRLDPPTLVKGQPWYVVPNCRVAVEISVIEVIEPDAAVSTRDQRRRTQARYGEVIALREGATSGKLLHP